MNLSSTEVRNTSKKTPSPTPPAHAAGAVPMAQIAGNANRGEIPVAMQGTHGTAVVDTRIVPGTTPQLLSGGTSQGEQRREPNMAISHTGEIRDGRPGRRPGTEGLSQEELDEMNDDPDADEDD